MIRLTVPSIDEDDINAVREVLKSGFLVQGSWVKSFENIIAKYVGVDHAIAVSNCTAALHLSLMALGIGRDDFVLVTAYSWIATANVIELCGAKPVFVDIEPDTFNIDPNRLLDKLNQLMRKRETAKRTKAILPVHAFGQMAQMEAIMEFANRYELSVIEDAACALGATHMGRQAGTWGLAGCFSFHPLKNITTGEGGIVTTDNIEFADNLRALRNHGQNTQSRNRDFILPGLNYRMTEFQAALGITQMKKLDSLISSRRELASGYNRLFDCSQIVTPITADDNEPVFQTYVTLLPKKQAHRRDWLIERLRTHGIETSIGTIHMPLTSYYRNRYGHQPGDFPITDDVYVRSLSLPMFEALNMTEQKYIVDTILGLL